MEKKDKISLISAIVLTGFTVGVFVHYILGFYMHFPFPFNTFLFGPDMNFSDFFVILPKEFFPTFYGGYFPLGRIILSPFLLFKNQLFAYFIFVSIFFAFLIYMNLKNFLCRDLGAFQNFQNLFTLTFLSYPVLYCLDRGNLDMLLVILFAGFVYALKSEKYLSAAVLLAIQNAVKPFPLLFLFLFLFKKRYKEFFFSVIITALLVIGGFMVSKGNFFDQMILFIKGLSDFKFAYVYSMNDNGMTNTSSLFTALKLFLCKNTPLISTFTLVKIYDALCSVITAIALFFTWREKVFWKKITLLSTLMLLTPYFVADYKLVFLFIPIWLFVSSQEKTRFDLLYTVLFGLLMIPKQFLIFWVNIGEFTKYVIFGIAVNPLLMIILISAIICEQFGKAEGVKNEKD